MRMYIRFKLGKGKRKLEFESEWAEELEDSYKIVIPNKDGITGNEHNIKKDIIFEIERVKEKDLKKKKVINRLTGF